MQEINKPKFKKDQSVRLKPKEECSKIDKVTAKELFEYLSENDLKSEQYIYGIKKANIFKNILYAVNFGERKVIHDIPESFLDALEEDFNKKDSETESSLLLEQVQNYIEKAPLKQVSDFLFATLGIAMLKYPKQISIAIQFNDGEKAKRFRVLWGKREIENNSIELFFTPATEESDIDKENLWKVEKSDKKIPDNIERFAQVLAELEDRDEYWRQWSDYANSRMNLMYTAYKEAFNPDNKNRIAYLKSLVIDGRSGYKCFSGTEISYDEISKLQTETYRKKNADYGDSFKQSMDEDGILVAKIRIGDKIRRLESLLKKGGEGLVKDERLQDTFLDLANYCVMTILWLKGCNE